MYKLNNFISVFVLSCFLILTACSKPVSVEQVATQFRNAINNKNITSLVSLINTPLIVVEQQWETTKDGIGFVLGTQTIKKITNKNKLNQFAVNYSSRVAIEGNIAMLIPKSEFANFKTELSSTEKIWQPLTVYLFKRGESDVEHIVLVGINPMDKKIYAIYIN